MTTLEGILIAVLWIGYGLFSAYQTEARNEDEKVSYYIFYTIFAPIVLICKVLYGAFKKYE